MAKTNAPAVPDEDRVDLLIPRGGINEDPNFLICINGVTYLLPKGKKSSVPKYVAEEYYRSVAAQEDYDATVDAIISKSN